MCYFSPQYCLALFSSMWHYSSTDLCPKINCFYTFYCKFLKLFSDLIVLKFSLNDKKFPDWKNFSHFSRFSHASGNLKMSNTETSQPEFLSLPLIPQRSPNPVATIVTTVFSQVPTCMFPVINFTNTCKHTYYYLDYYSDMQ